MRVHIYTFIALAIVTALQIAGPFYVGFANWCNIIQYVSGYAYAGVLGVAIHFIIHYYKVHKPRMERMEAHLQHLREERHP